jgi:hypothetical protein
MDGYSVQKGGSMNRRWQWLYVLATSACGLVSVAFAADDPMTIYYANTLHETRANGTQSWYRFNADHSFSRRDADGKASTGTWTLNEKGETCITLPNQPAQAPPACAKLEARRVGDGFDRQGHTGKEHFVLEAGRD